jgi:hypothetical protein
MKTYSSSSLCLCTINSSRISVAEAVRWREVKEVGDKRKVFWNSQQAARILLTFLLPFIYLILPEVLKMWWRQERPAPQGDGRNMSNFVLERASRKNSCLNEMIFQRYSGKQKSLFWTKHSEFSLFIFIKFQSHLYSPKRTEIGKYPVPSIKLTVLTGLDMINKTPWLFHK